MGDTGTRPVASVPRPAPPANPEAVAVAVPALATADPPVPPAVEVPASPDEFSGGVVTTGRLLPGVFAEERHLVPANAPTHHSAHLGERYRAVCRALCLPVYSGSCHTWRRWPICANCARHLLGVPLPPLHSLN